MPATTSSRLAVKPSTTAGMLGARQLSLAKLARAQAGVGRASTISSDLQIRAKGLSPAGTAGGARAAERSGRAANTAPAAAIAATRTMAVAIRFSIWPLRI